MTLSATLNGATAAPDASSTATQPAVNTAEWNQFVAASPYGDVLQCLEWGEVKRPDWTPVPVSVQTGERLDATALVLRRDIPRSGRTLFYVSRGPILDWSQSAVVTRLVERLKTEAEQHRAVLIKVDPAVPVGTPGVVETLQQLGFIPSPDATSSFGGTQPRYVMKLDIAAPLDQVMAGFHQKWRYNIRLAERKGVTVRQDCGRDDLKVFHELYRVTAARDGFKGYPLAYFQRLWDVLVTRDMARLFITSYEGQPLSAAISLLLPPQCWYVFGASSNEHRNLMPNHLMQWTMMRWAKDNGCTVYDFRGVHDVAKTAPAPSSPGTSSPGTNGLATDGLATEGAAAADVKSALINHPDGLVRFKAGFNADLVEYVGEWDLPLNKQWYWLWTSAKPKLTAAAKKLKAR